MMPRGIPKYPMVKLDPPETFYWGPEIDRDTAMGLGRIRFFTGSPCKWGHVSERWCLSRRCVECVLRSHRTPEYREEEAPYSVAYRKANPERVEAFNAQRRAVQATKPVKSEARREGNRRAWVERRACRDVA